MSEKVMRQNLVKSMKRAGLDPISMEGVTRVGFPDVNYADGVAELKKKDEWPKRETTKLALDHFTQNQRIILRRRWRAGGNAFLIVQVGEEWLLFDGDTAFDIVGRPEGTRTRLYEVCLVRWGHTRHALAESGGIIDWLDRRNFPQC